VQGDASHPGYKVVYPKKNNQKKRRAEEEEERHEGLLTPTKSVTLPNRVKALFSISIKIYRYRPSSIPSESQP
jgi:hypothetical protein